MRPLAPLIPALCAGLALGCGDDEGEERPARPVTVEAGRGLRVLGDEYLFDPNRVSIVGAPRGKPTAVRITLENKGALAHNLKVFTGDQDVGGTPTFPGGRTESGTVRLLPGQYRMVCTVGNHAELGMVGELEVRVR